jgi:hypothetical protein
MKNITTRLMLFLAAAALCITINSCKKSATDSDLSTVQDEAQANNESNYVGNVADAGADNQNQGAPRSSEGGSQIVLPACATVTLTLPPDTSTQPRTLTINFGTTGCTCYDGKVRTGEVIVTWTGRYRDSGTVIHTYTSNYAVNGNAHKINKVVTNVGRVNGLYTFDITDADTVVTGTGTIYWNSTRTRTWTSGYNYPLLWWLTQYSITGTASGVDRKGVSFTAAITSPILVNFSCIYVIDGGSYYVQPAGKAERTISFINGCSGQASCTIDGVTYDFNFTNY